jgi:hypothetical protein
LTPTYFLACSPNYFAPTLTSFLGSRQKNNYSKNPGATAARLERFLSDAARSGAASVLLVSGGGKKRAFDTVAALRHLSGAGGLGTSDNAPAPQKRQRRAGGGGGERGPNGQEVAGGGAVGKGAGRAAAWPPLYVAFNPYLPSEGAQRQEEESLRSKLATGLVAGVYLQVLN